MSTLNRGFSKPDLSPANGRPAAAGKAPPLFEGAGAQTPDQSLQTVPYACWSLLHSLFEVVLLDTRQLGAPDLFSRQRPLKVPSDITKKSTTKPAYSSRFDQVETSLIKFSLLEVVLLDTRQLGAPDLFSRQRPLKVPSDSTKKSTKPAYSILSKFDQGEASSNVTETFCHQEPLISTANLEHQIYSVINDL